MTHWLLKKQKSILLFSLIIAGAFLRFYGLDHQSLWNDELFTWKCSVSDRWNDDGHASWERGTNSSVTKTIDTAIYDIHPPGYLILIHYFCKYFGDSEYMLRAPSAFFGVLSILIIFFIGKHIYSEQEGLLAAALMAFLWCPIYFSQEARTYSILLFTTVLSTYCWIIILQRLYTQNQLPNLFVIVGYIAAGGISCWLHYFGTFFILLQAIASYVLFARKIRCLFLITFALYLPIALVYLPWVPVMIMHSRLNAPTYTKPTTVAFFKFIKFCFNESIFFFFLVSVLYMRLLYWFFKTHKKNSTPISDIFFTPEFCLALWLVVPFAGAFVKSVLGQGSVYQNKNLIISLPAAYLLLARAITTVPISSRKRMGTTIFLIGGFLYHLLFVMDYYERPVKQQFREGVEYIIDNTDPNEKTFIIGNAWDKDYYNYYFEKKGSSLRASFNPIYLFFHPGGLKRAQQRVLNEISDHAIKHVWFISSFDSAPQPFVDFLNNHLHLVDYKHFIHIMVWRYKK